MNNFTVNIRLQFTMNKAIAGDSYTVNENIISRRRKLFYKAVSSCTMNTCVTFNKLNEYCSALNIHLYVRGTLYNEYVNSMRLARRCAQLTLFYRSDRSPLHDRPAERKFERNRDNGFRYSPLSNRKFP